MGSVDAVPRRAARVILLDAADRVLLLRIHDPGNPEDLYWITPGGGAEFDEGPAECAVRELYEETGLRLEPAALVGPVHHEVVEFPFEGVWYRQEQEYFVARVAQWSVAPTGLTAFELRSWLGHRWWGMDELETTADRCYPPDLPALLRSVGAGVRGPSALPGGG